MMKLSSQCFFYTPKFFPCCLFIAKQSCIFVNPKLFFQLIKLYFLCAILNIFLPLSACDYAIQKLLKILK